jgi:hypothetical protein
MARLTGRDDDADTAAEAAREIERLRLTDAEREAIAQTIDAANGMAPAEPWTIATLRSLLARIA